VDSPFPSMATTITWYDLRHPEVKFRVGFMRPPKQVGMRTVLGDEGLKER
jgi:hypothetical protein